MNFTSTSLTWLARAGQLAKGIIFFCAGMLSAFAAWQGRGGAQDSRGALRGIMQQPFGRVLLVAIIVGLVCYVLWRVLAAIADLERKGRDAKGLVLRARMLFVAGIYTGLTAAAVKMLRGGGRSGGGDEAARDWTARGLSTPFGSWLVVLVGVGIAAWGVGQCIRAWRGKFEEKLDLAQLTSTARMWLVRISAFGLAARGVVFTIAGIFLIQAGWHSDAAEARGLGGALNSLQSQPQGRWLFGIVAVGLAAYGIYCGVRARYGRWG